MLKVVKKLGIKKVKLGENLAVGDYADTLFEEMLLGNTKKGIVGLGEIMYEQGFTWEKSLKMTE